MASLASISDLAFCSLTTAMPSSSSRQLTGSQVIALSLQKQGVTHIFGIVGIPVIEVAQACIDLGIRFISFRNEQAASYVRLSFFPRPL
jgi:2-hydroxyacyl-CoA lyase 1